MLTLEKAKLNLRIDEDDEYFDTLIEDILSASKIDIQEATGVPENFMDIIKDENLKEQIDSLYTRCQMISVSDAWYERDTINRALNSLQIKLELLYIKALKTQGGSSV